MQLEPTTARLGRDVREPKEVKRLGPLAAVAFALLAGIAPEPQHPSLLRVQLQAELREALGHCRRHRACVLFVLKAQHHVVGVAHDGYLPSRVPLSPLLDPQIERVMQVDVRQQGADSTPLWRSLLHCAHLAVLQDACVQPLHQQPHHALVCNRVLDELLHPSVLDRVVKCTNIRVEHPVHLPADGHRESIQSPMRRPARPEAIRELQKLLLVDGLQDHPCCLLNDLVFQRRNAERARATISFRNVHAPNRLWMIVATVNTVLKVTHAGVQILAVRAPRDPIDARSRVLAKTVVRLRQEWRLDVAQQVGEVEFQQRAAAHRDTVT